jgi:hypothetical protein
LKQIVDSVVAEVWKLKVQVQLVESKAEVDTRKYHVVLDCSVVSPVVFGFLGVLIGVLVAGLWKCTASVCGLANVLCVVVCLTEFAMK